MERRDIAIIGTGPGGVSAAITAKIRGKQLWLFGTRHLSEKLEKAKTILNYPGLPAVSGMALADGMRAQLKSLDIPILETQVTAVYAMGDYFAIQTPTEMYEASAVILAAGVVMGKPFPGEKELLGRGVSYCATCDAPFYRDKTVAVVGYSEHSQEEASFLAETAKEVLYFPAVPHEPRPGPRSAFWRTSLPPFWEAPRSPPWRDDPAPFTLWMGSSFSGTLWPRTSWSPALLWRAATWL